MTVCNKECDAAFDGLKQAFKTAQEGKMWYRRALYFACGGDKEKVRTAMAATEFTTMGRDGVQREIAEEKE